MSQRLRKTTQQEGKALKCSEEINRTLVEELSILGG